MIYFVQRANGDIKIGRTDDYLSRLTHLQSKHGKLVLLGLTDGSDGREWELHQQFAHLRIDPREEWFRPADDLFTFINANTHMDVPKEANRTMIRVSLATKIAIETFISEYAIKTGKRISLDDALRMIIEAADSELLERAEVIYARRRATLKAKN
jgi:hypothetical protein